MYYKFNPDQLTAKTQEAIANLAKNQPKANFVEYASSVIYDRLKQDIQHYRQYGPYWWALKDILRRQDYNVGNETDERLQSAYQGKNDAETLVAADNFYADNAGKYSKDNMDWTIEKDKTEYRLFDEDMEMRPSITDLIV